MRVVTFSRKRRSCETRSTVPSKPTSASSRISAAGMSRWFVGSSRKRRLRGSRSSLASARRDRSPPEKPLTTRSGSSPQKRKRARYWRAASTVKSPRTRRTSSTAVSDGSTSPRCWSKYPSCRFVPRLTVPAIAPAPPRPARSLRSVRLAGAVRPDDADALAAPDEQVDARRRACARRARRRGPSRRGRCRRCARRARSGTRTRSAIAHTSSGRSRRSSFSSILRRLCACFVFWPAMFLRMKSSVLSINACWRSTSARSRARSSSRATA